MVVTILYGLFFFFQAEDGIRDDLVTGVQTCASSDLAGQGLAQLEDDPPRAGPGLGPLWERGPGARPGAPAPRRLRARGGVGGPGGARRPLPEGPPCALGAGAAGEPLRDRSRAHPQPNAGPLRLHVPA